MHKTHILGFPRLGPKREYKKALESYWNGKINKDELERRGAEIRRFNWQTQAEAGLDFVTIGDFSWYDQVLTTSMLVGAIPSRFGSEGEPLDILFRMARGRAPTGKDAHPCEMTKWFNTNYHYLVPELGQRQEFKLFYAPLLAEVREAQQQGYKPKAVLLGPVSYLWLAQCAAEDFNRLGLLDSLCSVYKEVLAKLSALNVERVQLDEPILALDLPSDWQNAFRQAYQQLASPDINILLTVYFGELQDNLALARDLPVAGVHLDASQGDEWLDAAASWPEEKVLSVGIINGRNVWRANLRKSLILLEKAAIRHKNLWVASSCSLLHSPVDLNSENKLPIKQWLAFAKQKCKEVALLGQALNKQVDEAAFKANADAVQTRQKSSHIHKEEVAQRIKALNEEMKKRQIGYEERARLQQSDLQLPQFPTTTIGSFPQTAEIRTIRSRFRKGEMSESNYTQAIRAEIKAVIAKQDSLGLDVLVHGEPERNDMVEYFGELLDGVAVTEMGWVQSYGSRCVKPPIIYGDITRPAPMTVTWSAYAQSCTKKPVKGMLTGPVTMLCWSFVRDDLPLAEVAYQFALTLRDEVADLEKSGLKIIQIDEPALREGLPLRKKDWSNYLKWAVDSFRLASCGAQNTTQIHSHMCYSQFNDIIQSIAALDADVISIECSRSNMKLLDVFDDFNYPNSIGPGVYDIHSPLVPAKNEIESLLKKAVAKIPAERLWVNPDCGLKTRGWEETEASLNNMVQAALSMRR